MSGRVVTSSLSRHRPFVARLRRFFAGPTFGRDHRGPQHPPAGAAVPSPPPTTEPVFARQARQFATAQGLVRGFYGFALYYAVVQCAEFASLPSRVNFVPLWPVAWMPPVPDARAPAIVAVLAFYVLASVLGVFFARDRWARLLVFVGMLEYFAFRNSFGKIGHGAHLLVLIALLLVFLPANWHCPATSARHRTRQETLLVLWLCQAALLLTYTMSGLDKLGGALYQIAVGQQSVFSPGALGAHIAKRLVQTHSQSPLGSFIIGHPYLTWPFMPGALYLEFFAFWVAFRPALQRWWALALILFHVATIFTLTITFPVACLLLALFFFHSPFQPAAVGWRAVLTSAPLLGGALLRWPFVVRPAAGSLGLAPVNRPAPRLIPVSCGFVIAVVLAAVFVPHFSPRHRPDVTDPVRGATETPPGARVGRGAGVPRASPRRL